MAESKNRNEWVSDKQTPDWQKEFAKFRTYCPKLNSGKGSCAAACTHVANAIDTYENIEAKKAEELYAKEGVHEREDTIQAIRKNLLFPMVRTMRYCGNGECGSAIAENLEYEKFLKIPKN